MRPGSMGQVGMSMRSSGAGGGCGPACGKELTTTSLHLVYLSLISPPPSSLTLVGLEGEVVVGVDVDLLRVPGYYPVRCRRQRRGEGLREDNERR